MKKTMIRKLIAPALAVCFCFAAASCAGVQSTENETSVKKTASPAETTVLPTQTEPPTPTPTPVHTHEFGEWTVVKEATCTEDGMKERACSCGETESAVIAAGHTVIEQPAVPSTCTEDGLTAGSACSVCGAVFTPQETIPATGHHFVDDPAIEPTCTEEGHTAGSHCEGCGMIKAAQEVIPPKGHVIFIDHGYAPTCVSTGLTEGAHCPVCGATLAKQEIIPKCGHHYVNGLCEWCDKVEKDAPEEGTADWAAWLYQFGTYDSYYSKYELITLKRQSTCEDWLVDPLNPYDPTPWENWGTPKHFQFLITFDTEDFDLTFNTKTEVSPYTWHIWYKDADTEEPFKECVTKPWSLYDWGDGYYIFRLTTYSGGMTDVHSNGEEPNTYQFLFCFYSDATGELYCWHTCEIVVTNKYEEMLNEALENDYII